MTRVPIQIEYCCPHRGCAERSDKKPAIEWHMPACRFAATSIKAFDTYYEAHMDHLTGRLLDRALAALTDNAADFHLTDEELNRLYIFHQQLIWALSGDPNLQSWASSAHRAEG